MANKRRKSRSLLAAHTAEADRAASGFFIPVRWVNNVIAIFLLAPAILLTQTFFHAFSRETSEHSFWLTEEFWFFMVGAVFWAVLFFGVPRRYFTYTYVLGHEWTHAVWVFLMGGRVSECRVSSQGGHIITDTHNFWIALAPYFYPIYSMALLVAYSIAGFFVDVQLYHRWFFALLGLTWAFHISFTIWMIPKGQSDLSYHGNFFSVVLIYIMNLVALSAMLIVGSPHVTWLGFGHELFQNTVDFSAWIFALAQQWIADFHPAG